MNVVLVRPQDVSFSAYNSAEHPGLAYIAGALRKDGYKTCIVDAVIGRLTVEECAESILACDPDLVGFTVFQQSLWNTVEMARALRQRKYQGHITTGGHFATFAYQDILAEFDCIDSVVRFEGEGAACDLARMLKNGENWKNVPGLAYRQNGSGKIAYNPRPKLMNLDMLAMPARDTLGLAIANGSNYASIVSSRGCWGQCAFCTLAAMDHGWRAHSPNRVVGEIEILYRQGVNRFLFTDSNFLGAGSRGKERATKIADKIIRRRLEIAFSIYTRVDCITRDILSHLKGAGLTTVYLGIESGSQAVLDRWK